MSEQEPAGGRAAFTRFAWGVLIYNLAVVIWGRLRPRHGIGRGLRRSLAAV